MPLLSATEALHVSDSFLVGLYGTETFHRWKELKNDMNFTSECEYVNWLIDIAYQYRSDETYSGQYDMGSGAEDGTRTQHETHGDNESLQKSQHLQNLEWKAETTEHNDEALDCKNTMQKCETDYNAVGGDKNKQISSNDFVNEEMILTRSNDHKPWIDMETGPGTSYKSDAELLCSGEEIYLSSDEDDTATTVWPSFPDDLLLAEGEQLDESNAKAFPCPHCKYSTNYKVVLIRHIEGIHQRIKAHTCPMCSYKSSRKSSISRHLILKHGYRSKYKCKDCGKYLATPSELQHHQKKCGVRSNDQV